MEAPIVSIYNSATGHLNLSSLHNRRGEYTSVRPIDFSSADFCDFIIGSIKPGIADHKKDLFIIVDGNKITSLLCFLSAVWRGGLHASVVGISARDNDLGTVKDSYELLRQHFCSLRDLVLTGNPVTQKPGYVKGILSTLPALNFLDTMKLPISTLLVSGSIGDNLVSILKLQSKMDVGSAEWKEYYHTDSVLSCTMQGDFPFHPSNIPREAKKTEGRSDICQFLMKNVHLQETFFVQQFLNPNASAVSVTSGYVVTIHGKMMWSNKNQADKMCIAYFDRTCVFASAETGGHGLEKRVIFRESLHICRPADQFAESVLSSDIAITEARPIEAPPQPIPTRRPEASISATVASPRALAAEASIGARILQPGGSSPGSDPSTRGAHASSGSLAVSGWTCGVVTKTTQNPCKRKVRECNGRCSSHEGMLRPNQFVDGENRIWDRDQDRRGYLGKGAFGVVYRMTLESNPSIVSACKFIEIHRTETKLIEMTCRELVVMRGLKQSENVVNCISIFGLAPAAFDDTCPDMRIFRVFLEFSPDGDLCSRLPAHPTATDEPYALNILNQIAHGLQHIHQHKIVHRDLKPENILVSGETLKLCDFGLASVIADGTIHAETKASMGTPYYLSPEVCRQQPATTAVDIWAVGVIAYQLGTGSRPFDHPKDPQVIIHQILSQPPNYNNFAFSAAYRIMVQALMSDKPEQRPTASQLIKEIELM